MDPLKERYYHAQAAKLDLRRKWQSMAIWPVVHRHGERVRMEFEYQCGAFKIDLYIPALRLAVEVDEQFHDFQGDADRQRQDEIAAALGCEFVRLRVSDVGGLFQQVEQLQDEVARRIAELGPPEWVIAAPRRRTATPLSGGYSERNRQRLAASGIADRVEDMKADLGALQVEVTDELGPVAPSNGELGFTARLPGVTFCVSVRANEQAKLLVTRFDPAVLPRLGITLDGPKHGKVDYWAINEFQGRFSTNEVVGKLATYRQLLDSCDRPSG